jgi:uronate dehydrogenase
LLTGAASAIGTAFRRYAGDRYWFRLVDRVTHNLADAATQGHDVLALDVAELAACQEACKTINVVIHLAADASPGADFYGSLLDNNIKGTYNVFRAAKDQGCRRVIFASSAQVMAGYPRDVQAHPETPVRPVNMYGVSKCFGEAVASYFAHAEGLSSIAIRIGPMMLAGTTSIGSHGTRMHIS